MNKDNKLGIICLKCENKFQNFEVNREVNRFMKSLERNCRRKSLKLLK